MEVATEEVEDVDDVPFVSAADSFAFVSCVELFSKEINQKTNQTFHEINKEKNQKINKEINNFKELNQRNRKK